MSEGQRLIPARGAAISFALAAVLAISGCSMMMQMRPAADSYTYDVGLATAPQIRARAADILTHLGYEVTRDDGRQRIYIESQWLSRQPADEVERAAGRQIISRVTLAGEPAAVAGATGLFRVRVTVENRFVPTHGIGRDEQGRLSSSEYARSIVKQMSVAFGGSAAAVANEPRPF